MVKTLRRDIENPPDETAFARERIPEADWSLYSTAFFDRQGRFKIGLLSCGSILQWLY